MSKTLFCVACTALAASVGTPAWATEYGTILSKTPTYAQVTVPQRQCSDEEQTTKRPQTGAGALIGALVGGGVGNALGSGGGRAAATGLGVIAGAVVGDRVEANGSPSETVTVQQCRTVNTVETRLIGYDVVYEYGGRRYNARVPNDPGDRIALNVNVAPAGAPAAAPPPVTYVQPPPVVYSAPPVYYPAPPYYYYGPPVYVGPRVGVDLVIGGGRRHWH